MVGALPPRARLACAAGRNARSLPRLALRSAAAADNRPGGDALLSGLHCEMAHGRGPGRRPSRRSHERFRRSRILFAGTEPARLREGNRPARRPLSERGSRLARASRRRRIHRRGGRGDRLQPPDGAGRRQYRPRSSPAHCSGRADRSRARRNRRPRRGRWPPATGLAISLRPSWTSARPSAAPAIPLAARARSPRIARLSAPGLPRPIPSAPRRRRDRGGRARSSSPAAPTAPSSLAAGRLAAFSPRPLSCQARLGRTKARMARSSGPRRSSALWRRLPGEVEQVFTHFALSLTVYAAEFDGGAPAGCFWVAPDAIRAVGFSSMMRKAVEHALAKT